MKETILDQIHNLPPVVIRIAVGLTVGLLGAWLTQLVLSATLRKTKSHSLKALRSHCFKAFNIFLPVLFIFVCLHYEQPYNDISHFWFGLFKILLILSTSFLLIKSTYALQDIILNQYDLKKVDNRQERKIVTQMLFIKKALIVAIVLVTAGVLLLSFEEGRKYGAGLLTSAGVASIIIGFAAQKSIGNFLAGIQIAFTQPMKLDDAVVVENEWGWIEEINLTYVVVRLWDWRRLVLPITYFIEKPFQNWTRTKGEIIGSVFLHLDYRAPIQALRQKLSEILKEEPNWDGKVDNLQVSDTKEFVMVVRALMSAKTSPQAWDLRCSVREKLITFLQEQYPESLPIHRVSMENK